MFSLRDFGATLPVPPCLGAGVFNQATLPPGFAENLAFQHFVRLLAPVYRDYATYIGCIGDEKRRSHT